ncbi:hypothetical protein PUN28_002193 [Cardiocondyla obscurior]|uniref:Uncharacterized protein n=1 Tax=Cardiocondyla obscurior TaxID=286306 RepID=A0AAW2GSV3_9HYME
MACVLNNPPADFNKNTGRTQPPQVSAQETTERLSLKAEFEQSLDIPFHPAINLLPFSQNKRIFFTKITGFICIHLVYEEDKKNKKKHKAEELKILEEIMRKFSRKETLITEASKLNPEILAYISTAANNRDKHFFLRKTS